MIEDWRGRRVTVMGLGRFGGGVGVTRWLAAAGARLIVTDKEPPEKLASSLGQIADLDLTLHLGGHQERDFRDTDLVVVNPAVPETSPFLQVAREAGVRITTEINLFVERCPARCIGVTGSVGKSTITAMIGHVLQEAMQPRSDQTTQGKEQGVGSGEAGREHWPGRAPEPRPPGSGPCTPHPAPSVSNSQSAAPAPKSAAPSPYSARRRLAASSRPQGQRRIWVGGNIGGSLLDGLGQIGPEDIVVLELSSFQLQRTPLVRWSPHVAVITGIVPNHLDWHGGFDAYVAAKMNIIRYQDRGRDLVVVQDDLELVRIVTRELGGRRSLWCYGLDGELPVARSEDQIRRWPGLRLSFPGRHNRENAAAALAVAWALGIPTDRALAALSGFRALPHRLQEVARRDGVVYYDDSKSTTPQATLTALRAFDAPLLVILGGYDKGSDLAPVAMEAARRAKFAAGIGATGRRVVEMIRAAGGSAEFCGDLATAVAECRRRALPGDVVLLSPACASWDQFEDYRARGKLFAQLVQA